MSYGVKIDEAERKAQNALIATKIFDLMDKLQLEATEIEYRRWIWELLQNAKDVAFDNQQVSIEVNIHQDDNQKFVTFSHNGKPFSVDNLAFLIKQVSTKERATNANGEKPKTTGKFGTGFLTTHLLSKKVEITGVVKEPDLDYKSFVLPLDRSGSTLDEIIESVNKSLFVLRSLDSLPPFLNYTPDLFNTTFKYNLSEEGFEVAQIGVDDLHLSLPFTLAFLPSIRSVSIIHENTTYELKGIENVTEIIKIATIIKRDDAGVKEIFIVTLSKNTTTIAIEIEKRDEIVYVLGLSDDMPRLFCDFPLIGSNDFNLPVVVNSYTFNPTEPRDGVWLKDQNNDPKNVENKQNIQDSIELYFELLEYASENNWQHLFNLARTDKPKEKKWFSMSWFEEYYQKPVRKRILKTPIVDNYNNVRTSILNEENEPNIWFPSSNNKEVRERIWELSLDWIPNFIPKKEEIHSWHNIIWDECSKLTLKVVSNSIHSKETIAGVAEMLKCDENGAINWLNSFYDLLNFERKFILEIINNNFAIIPNQNGTFKKRIDLRIDQNIDEELKNVMLILGVDIRDYLRHSKVVTISAYQPESNVDYQILYHVKEQQHIIDEINKTIKEGKNDNISKACDHLSSCFSDDSDFPVEQNLIYNFAQAIWQMPEKRIITNWDESIWQEVNKCQIKWLISAISETQKIENFKEVLKKEDKETLKWLNSFVEFLTKFGFEDRLNLKTSPILPNQNGVFCIKDDLFLDNGLIDEELKDILESLDYNLRNELLDVSIYLELPKSRERTEEYVADEITRLVTPLFSELPRSEQTKMIFKSIYLWFNKYKEKAESLFQMLYSNKHKLYDDDEIAANMLKAEKFDNILKEFNIETEEELKSRLNQGSFSFDTFFGEELISKEDEESIYKKALLFILEKLKEVNINSIDEFIHLIDNIKEGNILIRHNPTGSISLPDTWTPEEKKSYAVKITLEAISATLPYLKNLGYEILNFADTEAPTIYRVKFEEREFKVVIRPSHSSRYTLSSDEREALSSNDTELWISNGRDVSKETLINFVKRILDSGAKYIPTEPFIPGRRIG